MNNLMFGWMGMMCGCISGILPGLNFHREDWWGGYASWSRRMARLGHVSFFGIGMLNLLFALSVPAADGGWSFGVASGALILGAVAMPTVCYLSAWRSGFRHLFFIPAGALVVAMICTVKEVLS